jgi:hypothetical protein
LGTSFPPQCRQKKPHLNPITIALRRYISAYEEREHPARGGGQRLAIVGLIDAEQTGVEEREHERGFVKFEPQQDLTVLFPGAPAPGGGDAR